MVRGALVLVVAMALGLIAWVGSAIGRALLGEDLTLTEPTRPDRR